MYFRCFCCSVVDVVVAIAYCRCAVVFVVVVAIVVVAVGTVGLFLKANLTCRLDLDIYNLSYRCDC